ncbi:hypothetical protein ES705_44139 [subsurface metagenome]
MNILSPCYQIDILYIAIGNKYDGILNDQGVVLSNRIYGYFHKNINTVGFPY